MLPDVVRAAVQLRYDAYNGDDGFRADEPRSLNDDVYTARQRDDGSEPVIIVAEVNVTVTIGIMTEPGCTSKAVGLGC